MVYKINYEAPLFNRNEIITDCRGNAHCLIIIAFIVCLGTRSRSVYSVQMYGACVFAY